MASVPVESSESQAQFVESVAEGEPVLMRPVVTVPLAMTPPMSTDVSMSERLPLLPGRTRLLMKVWGL